MAYYTKVLQPDETVKFVGRLHWIIYWKAIVLGMLSACVAVLWLNQPESQRPALTILLAVLLGLAVIFFVLRWFHRVGTEIVVTDKRIIHKTGWIARNTEEMNVTKVETVDVFQGIAGRILGYGNVRIIGTGATWEPLRQIGSPLELRNAIMVG
jgi:uncharacterized membrane protein YdbT with pleckstrin-like domain